MNDKDFFEGQQPSETPVNPPSDNHTDTNQASGTPSGENQNLNGWQSYSANSNPQTPPQQNAASQQQTTGWTSPNTGTSGQQPNHTGGFQQQTPPQQNTEYQWTFEDYDQISKNPNAVRTKSNTGLKVFAIVMTVVFILTAIAFGGFIAYFVMNKNSNTMENSEVSEQIQDGPQLSLNNRPAPDEEEYTDGVLSTEEIAATVRPSVVGIVAYQSTTFPMESYSTGSGIIMSSDGYIITNAHVVNGATGIVVVLANEEEYEAQLVGIDEKTDLAVIKIEAENLTPAEFGNSDELVVGERVIAIGNPTGLNLAGSVTQGIVSGLERSIQVTDETTGTVIEMQAIQVDAAINPGNSGGALINKYGQVVGINSSKLSSTQIEGIGFAIPISTAKPIVDDLISYGYVRGRVLLGITYVAISDVTGAISGYTPGLWVQSVREDMDVYAQGVRPGDVIVQMDDQDVRDSDTVKAIMEGKKPGDTIKLKIVRTSVTGKVSTFTVDVELAEDKGSASQNTQQEVPQQQNPNQGGLQQLPTD
jgi:serine protease Do